jgi:hypothetical protein
MNWAIQDSLESLAGKTIESAKKEGRTLVLKMTDGDEYRVFCMENFETIDFYVDKKVEVEITETQEPTGPFLDDLETEQLPWMVGDN